ncbi:MAG: helix-turn-helix transcriptional regulator [Clostridiales bacterium]|nr:helix-turn-helix transcriptional regulator [Clostridiales bacterium]
MDIIQKLNSLRLERNLSVYRLAELTGINQSTLANTFSRGTLPNIQNLEAMCEAMGLTLSQFFAEEEMTEYLSAEEHRLIKDLRKLPAETKKSVENLIFKIAEN